jgi:hypothetical protein
MICQSLATGRDTGADRAARAAVAADGGLSSAEAAGRLTRYGPNELPRARRTPWWRLVAGQLRDPLILVLLAAVVRPTSRAISSMLTPRWLIRLTNEVRSSRAARVRIS